MVGRKLFRDLVLVMAVKLLALTAIYFLFFAAPARVDVARLFVTPSTSSHQR